DVDDRVHLDRLRNGLAGPSQRLNNRPAQEHADADPRPIPDSDRNPERRHHAASGSGSGYGPKTVAISGMNRSSIFCIRNRSVGPNLSSANWWASRDVSQTQWIVSPLMTTYFPLSPSSSNRGSSR